MQAVDFEQLGWRAPESASQPWWDPAAPLPQGLIDSLQSRFPAVTAEPLEGDADQAAAPARAVPSAPEVIECFLEYAESCQSTHDWASQRLLAPHFAVLMRSVESLAQTNVSEQKALPIDRLRAGWAGLLYTTGRYAEGWAASAGVPAALAGHAPGARRAAWIMHGLLALETGRHIAAGEALAAAEAIGAPGAPRTLADWQLALGQADLAAACDQDDLALAEYAALDVAAAPAWMRVRAALGRARIYTKVGQAGAAAPLIEDIGALIDSDWLAGEVSVAAAELALFVGQPIQASEHAAAARAALTEAFGEEHPATAAAALAEAQASYDCGAYAAAEYLSALALQQLQAAHGANHPRTMHALALRGLLAGIRGDSGALVRNLAGAEQAARALAETSDLAEISADMLECTISLTQGRAARARVAAMRALEQARSALDAVHPLTGSCLDLVAECERALGRWSVARVYGDMALALRQSVFGAEHPLTATSWEQLGHTFLDARAYAHARDAFELAVGIRRVALGSAHPLTATAQLALAHAAVALGDLAGAQAAAASALSGLERAHGTQHAATRSARALLGQFSSPLRRGWWITRARLRRLHLAA